MGGEYSRLGYAHFRASLPTGQVQALAEIAIRLIPPYRGELRRQNGRAARHEFYPGTDLLRNSLGDPHIALPAELSPFADALRALITGPDVFDCLHALDGAEHYTIHQSLLFMASQSTCPHLDSWSLDTDPRGYAHTLWIPLEDVGHDGGPPGLISWPVGRIIAEQELGLPAEGDFRGRHDRHQQAMTARFRAEGASIYTAHMRRGDMLVWASSTPHFSFPASPHPRRRLSLQVLVRPSHLPAATFVGLDIDRPMERINDRFDFALR